MFCVGLGWKCDVSGDELAISILTGRRPAYLRATVRSLLRHAAHAVNRAHVVLMINGPDDATLEYVESLEWVDELVVTGHAKVRPIGDATSELFSRCARKQRPYYMHLEDDWRCGGPGWIAKSLSILSRHRVVGQVRIRNVAERVSRSHLITHKLIKWKRRDGYRLGLAHYTFNPSIVRTRDALKIFPCGHEIHAMRKFVKTGLQTAQLVPGAFRHIGADSLRAAMGR